MELILVGIERLSGAEVKGHLLLSLLKQFLLLPLVLYLAVLGLLKKLGFLLGAEHLPAIGAHLSEYTAYVTLVTVTQTAFDLQDLGHLDVKNP